MHGKHTHARTHTHTHTHTHTGLCRMEGYEDAPIFKNRGMREREGPEISPCRRDRENGDTVSDRCRFVNRILDSLTSTRVLPPLHLCTADA